MICPDCGYDNIDGVDLCEACGQPLVQLDPAGSELEQSITRHPIHVLCTKLPVVVKADTSVRTAVAELVNRRIGCLLVEDETGLAGVFTERDVLNKVSSDLALNLDQPISSFMTPSPTTLTSSDSIAYALQCMDIGGYRHLPIVDETGTPIGIVSVRDILRFVCIRFGELRAQAG